MSKGSRIHAQQEVEPWERTESYRVPELRVGRADLPAIEQEIEGFARTIGTLPKRIPWWPDHGNVLETAYEVRLILEPRIAVITLGRGDKFADYWLNGPGPCNLRTAYLCLPHPTELGWEIERDRTFLLDGENARRRLTRSVIRSAAAAIKEEVSRHWHLAPELLGGVA